MESNYVEWPFVIYSMAVVGLVCGMLLLSYILGERHRGRETHDPYESGVRTTGMARVRFSAQFYLIAILFVIFDLEAVFLFAWAVATPEAGWTGFAVAGVFIIILTAALIYEWGSGALDIVNQRKGRTKQFLDTLTKNVKEKT